MYLFLPFEKKAQDMSFPGRRVRSRLYLEFPYRAI